ncbi:helix-turn-helix transcriptional regulator [Bacillus sp. WOD8 KX774193]|uniref:helix-turn-helix domain-containing protein n=1 Tax=Bacillus TaxID=1386 RepID=UPI000BFE276B|nr:MULTISPECIES: helix-turn-helix transcriptional regulator [Bacillus]MRA75561.1 XRE family transcriptional regulator [Bacillus thuringiensis]PGZ63191.1 transcriptional regulator [Bacillus cereus]KAA0756028.1 XRE family transcriptional regulator [Bacillus sp. BF2-3]MCR6463208.1 helix-turn-helix domain-containing protein [Bacillus paranthracis]MEC3859481.1 helix-turn-helix transcriptional regulator [Bacillus sp. WOD8 KX774193]
MIGVDVNSLPYQQKISYQMIKYLRLCRNMTQTQFGGVCKVDQGVLAKLERGDLPLSPHYETKILEGCKALNISELELVSVKRIVELKQNRGIN